MTFPGLEKIMEFHYFSRFSMTGCTLYVTLEMCRGRVAHNKEFTITSLPRNHYFLSLWLWFWIQKMAHALVSEFPSYYDFSHRRGLL